MTFNRVTSLFLTQCCPAHLKLGKISCKISPISFHRQVVDLCFELLELIPLTLTTDREVICSDQNMSMAVKATHFNMTICYLSM